ncbi:MAG TPA: hypothetical protein PKZ12_00810 [Smithellaceae bacterium]|nr:hypothetical protein [Smithellaceae bacterium]
MYGDRQKDLDSGELNGIKILKYDKCGRLASLTIYAIDKDEELLAETRYAYRENETKPYQVVNFSIPENEAREIMFEHSAA